MQPDRAIAQAVSSSRGRELLVELERHERATERRRKFDADVAAALIRY